MSLARVICETAEQLVIERATNSGDGFRQWVYPALPRDYTPNSAIASEVDGGMLRGLSALQIAQEIYERHS